MQTMGMKDVGTTCTQGFWNASLLAAIQGTHGGPWQEPGASHKECAGLPPADEPRASSGPASRSLVLTPLHLESEPTGSSSLTSQQGPVLGTVVEGLICLFWKET